MAEKYSEVNEFQVEIGQKLVKHLGIKYGDKLLDMGCGTGEITAFIADLAGEDGQVVGVDPDEERIKVALRKHCGVKQNISFKHGDSSSQFPHFNEEYYDVHYSSSVFLWLTDREKDIYLKAAFNCLKPGGRIAIQCQEKNPEIFSKVQELVPDDEIEDNRTPFQLVAKSVTDLLLKQSGFEILSSDYVKYDHKFSSLDCFLTWYCASGYIDESKILPHKKEAFAKKFVDDDGTIYLDMWIYRIIGKKPDSKC